MTLVTTLMQSLRAKYQPNTLDKNEVRPSRYGAWDFFQRQTDLAGSIMTDEVKSLIKRSTGNTVTVPVLNADEVTLSNVRTCTIPSDTETSALVTLTFATYSFGFTMTPARHFNNDISYQQLFDHKLEQYLLKFASTLDAASVNHLNVNRNIYHPADITKYYPVVGNALQVSQDEKEDFFNKLEAIMEEMDYYDALNIIGSTSLKPMLNRLNAQGAGNAINESFQFNNQRWNFTNRLTPAAGIESVLFSVPDGNVAVENRNTPDNIAGSRVPGKEWGEANVPIVNLKMGTFHTEDCADMTALDGGGARMSHLSRTKVEGFAWDTDIVFMSAYNSNPAAKYSPIEKIEISST